MSRSFILHLFCIHLLFPFSNETSFFGSLFASNSKVNDQKEESSQSYDEICSSTDTKKDEFESEWVDCTNSKSINPEILKTNTFIASLRKMILNCEEEEEKVLQCVEAMKVKLRRLEFQSLPIALYLAFFEELLKSTKPVHDALISRLLTYLYERLKKVKESDFASYLPKVIDLIKLIFIDGRSSELVGIAFKILYHFKQLDPKLCVLLYHFTLSLLERFPARSEGLLKNFYLLLAECPLSDYDPMNANDFQEPVKGHYQMAPVYRILTLKDVKEVRDEMLVQLPHDLGNAKLLDSHLVATGFLVTFNVNRKALSERIQIFSELLHKCTQPMLIPDLILWLLKNDHFNILEGIFIYMRSMLYELIQEDIYSLWEYVLTEPKANLNLAARLWAYLPPSHMSIEYLEALIEVWTDTSIESDSEFLESFRIIMLATEKEPLSTSQQIPSTWALPSSLKKYFNYSEQIISKTLHTVLVEVVQIFLARKAGLPFALTAMPKMPKEIFTWDDVINLINYLLEKFAESREITCIAKVNKCIDVQL